MHINKLMVRKLITEGCLLMLNVEGLFQIGDPVGWVVALEQLELEVKNSIRGILGESKYSLEEHHVLRNQEPGMIEIGRGRSPVKGSGTEKENEKGLRSALKTEQEIASIERIGTIEIVKETEIGKRRETVVVTVIERAIVIAVGTVVVIETDLVIVIVIAIVRGRGIETGIMKLVMLTMIVVILMIENMTLTKLKLSMTETGMVRKRETMIMWSRRMIVDGMNN